MLRKILTNLLRPKGKSDGKNPFEFKAPSYDNRSSSSISAGDDYGIGSKNAVGKESVGSYESGPIPQSSHCFSPIEVIKKDVEG